MPAGVGYGPSSQEGSTNVLGQKASATQTAAVTGTRGDGSRGTGTNAARRVASSTPASGGVPAATDVNSMRSDSAGKNVTASAADFIALFNCRFG